MFNNLRLSGYLQRRLCRIAGNNLYVNTSSFTLSDGGRNLLTQRVANGHNGQ